jgi:hypothetical protein
MAPGRDICLETAFGNVVALSPARLTSQNPRTDEADHLLDARQMTEGGILQ